MAAVKKKILCTLSWDGKIQAKLVVLVDPQGKAAKGGTPIDYFAKLNEKGLRAAQLIGTLDDTRFVCEANIKDVRAESARVGGKCKAVERALRLANDNQNNLLKDFNVAVANAKVMVKKVSSAHSTMLGGLKDLEIAKNELKKHDIDTLTEKTESQLKALKKERDETIKSIEEITKIAKVLVSKNLINIFTLALNKVATHSVKAEYQPELSKLADRIKSMKEKSAGLAKDIKLGEIKSATHKFNAGVDAYSAAESEFNARIDEAAQARKNLMNNLEGTPSKALADVMRAHKIQDQRVAIARRNIWEYKTGLQGALKSLSILLLSYKSAKNTLKKAVKKDSSYNPVSEYGKSVCGWAFQNGHHLEAWKRNAVSEIGYCKKQEIYLDDDSRKGPFGGFHKMNAMVDAARDKTRKELKANRLKCPV